MLSQQYRKWNFFTSAKETKKGNLKTKQHSQCDIYTFVEACLCVSFFAAAFCIRLSAVFFVSSFKQTNYICLASHFPLKHTEFIIFNLNTLSFSYIRITERFEMQPKSQQNQFACISYRPTPTHIFIWLDFTTDCTSFFTQTHSTCTLMQASTLCSYSYQFDCQFNSSTAIVSRNNK